MRKNRTDWPLRRPALASLVAALGFALAADGRQQAPRYKGGTDAFALDIVVTDEEGRPVPGLQPDDFRVTVDGQPRKVMTAQFLSSAARSAAPAGGGGKAVWDIDAAFRSVYVGNDRSAELEAAPTRNLIIAIDQGGFAVGAGRSAGAAARGLLDVLHPDDRVGLAVFPPPGPFVRPTRDHQRVRQALGQVPGASEPMPRGDVVMSVSDGLAWIGADTLARDLVSQRYCSPSTTPSVCRSELDRASAETLDRARRESLSMLRGLADVIRAVSLDGTPCAIVLVSTGVYAGGRASRLGVDGELRELGRLAAASRVMLYALHLDSGFLDRDSIERQRIAGFSSEDGDGRLEGLRQVTELAGGTVTRVTGGTDAVFRRVSLELSAYYLLGIESVAADRDGRRHRVRVSVARSDLTIRNREDLYLPAPRKVSGEEAVRDALRATELDTGLPIKLSAQTMRETGTDKVRLVVSALIGEGMPAPAPVRVGFVIRGAGTDSSLGTSEIQNRTLPLVGSGPDASLSYLDTAKLTPGRYLLRVAAADEKGRVGSVQQVVDATLIGSEVGSFSDLMLIDPVRKVKDAFTPVADGRVTGDSLDAFLEIYPGEGRSVGSVAFEVADMPGAPPMITGRVAPEKRSGGLIAGINLQIRALPPGVYVLNARILDGERIVGQTSRPFMVDRRSGAAGAAGAVEPRAALAFAGVGSLVGRFSRGEALNADALTYFLNRMQASETEPTTESITAATAAVRGARFDAALTALPPQSELLSVAFLRGLAHLGLGHLEPAAQEFRAALRISDGFLPAVFYLGACYAAGGHDREAAGAWQTALVSESGSRIIYEVLADALLRLSDGEQAEAIVQEARERWPGDDLFVPRLAAAKVLQERQAEALALLEPYIERHPGESEPLFLAIRLLYEAHDSGKRLKGAAEDRALAQKYGALYRSSTGANQPLVARWIAAMK